MLRNILLYIIILILLGSCNSQEKSQPSSATLPSVKETALNLFAEPSPLPNGFSEVKPKPGSVQGNVQIICVSINLRSLFSPGDNISSIGSDQFDLYIDQEQVATRDAIVLPTADITCIDFPNAEQGCGPSQVDICIPPEKQFDNGLYLSEFQFISTSGAITSYTWAFEVSR